MESVNNILILSTSNPYKTAGIAAYDIFNGFKERGYSVKLIVENYDNYEKDIISIQDKWEFYLSLYFSKFKNRLKKAYVNLFKLNPDFQTYKEYSFDGASRQNKEYSSERILKKAGFVPDAIIVIFSQYFISYKNLYELQFLTKAPIFWQFADMFPFTGGCHYAWDCQGYKIDCKSCPAIVKDEFKYLPSLKLAENVKYLKDLNVTAVIGSDWLISRAEQSVLFKSKSIKKIYLSVDSELFRPFAKREKLLLREKYGIDKDSYVILIMANHLSQKRKGVDIILKACDLLKDKWKKNFRVHLLIVGKGFEKVKYLVPDKIAHTAIEFVDRLVLPDLYNVSNLFCSASLQEVGPYTLTEALLCEIPVVSLRHGYAKEFVINDLTGYLVKDDTPASFANGIDQMLNLDEVRLNFIKKECRARTKVLLSKEKQIDDYIELINS